MSRRAGERIWDDPLGYPVHIDIANTPARSTRRSTYHIDEIDEGRYEVRHHEYTWLVGQGVDGQLEILESDCPKHIHDSRVLRAVQNQ